MEVFTLTSEYIELDKLLKLLKLTATGGQAKLAISDGFVAVNGQSEYRLRRKLRSGDFVEFDGAKIQVQ